jgi:hypothetical protein
MHSKWTGLRYVLAALVCVMAISPAFAQFTSGVEATVVDQSGAVVAGAQAVVIDQATQVQQTAVSNSTGYVRIQQLPPGTYRIEVKAPGFETWVQKDVILEGNQTRSFYPKLTVGKQQATVEVVGETQMVETTGATISHALEAETIAEAPLLGENVYASLATLAPGVSGTGMAWGTGAQGPNNFDSEPGFQIIAAGQRSDSNEFQVDGSSVNGNSRDGIVNITPEPDTIAEMKISTDTFSAEKGRQSGTLIELFTKSGTRKFHGSVSEMHTDNALTARTEFQTKVPRSIRNDFGGTIGGPLSRKGTFFFGSLYWMKGVVGQTVTEIMETSAFRNYVLQNNPNTVAAQFFKLAPAGAEPTSNFQTVGDIETALPSLYPTPPIPTSLVALGRASVSQSPINNGFQGHVRIDHSFHGEKDRLFYDLFRATTQGGSAAARPAESYVMPNSNWMHKVDYIHTFSPSLVNEVGVTYVRADGVDLNPTPSLPNAYTTGLDAGFSGWGTSGWVHNNWNYHDVLAYVRGAHNLRVGIDVDRQQDLDNFTNGTVPPSFSFTNIVDFAVDHPYSQSGPIINPRTGLIADNLYSRVLMLYVAPFVQDDWKVTRRLTVNLGMRLDDYAHIATLQYGANPIALFTPGAGSTFAEQVADGTMVHRSSNGAITSDPVWRIAPRVGFAWDVAGNGSTSVRGGWGMFNNKIGDLSYMNDNRTNTPDFADPSISIVQKGVTLSSFSYGTSSTGPLGFAPIPGISYQIDPHGGLVGTTVGVGGAAPNMTAPLVQDWAVSVQRRVGRTMMVEADYFGTDSKHLYLQTDVNRFAGDLIVNKGTLTRLNSSFASDEYGRTIGYANSNVGSVSFTKQVSKGWTAHTTYTYGKALDITSSNDNGVAFISPENIVDAQNPFRQYGRADYDARHRFSAYGVWTVPSLHSGVPRAITSGWTFSPIITLESGQPFSVYTSASFPTGDYNADGYGYDYPDTPTFGNHISTSRSDFLKGVFPASAFPKPTPEGTEGNLGRNTYDGPGLAMVNFSAERVIPIHLFSDKGMFQIRGEFINLFNRVNLLQPDSNLSSGGFGQSTSQNTPRAIQLIAHIRF